MQDLTVELSPSGFHLRDIALPVHVWHGDLDRNVMVESGTYQASEIPNATLHRLPLEGHWLVYSHFDDILDSLAASATCTWASPATSTATVRGRARLRGEPGAHRASIDGKLCSSLTEGSGSDRRALPGWSVQDNLSHLVDYESRSSGARDRTTRRPISATPRGTRSGSRTEVGVDYRQPWTGEEVLAEFREVTAARLVQLRSFTDDDLAQPVDTPAGPGTVADMPRCG